MEKETKDNIKTGKITILISAVVIGLFLLLLIQCRKYALQNQELSAMLGAMDETMEAYAGEIERLQDLLAAETYEYETETGYMKKGDVYFVDTTAQLDQLKQMIEDEVEIEPGVAAAEASYRLRQNLKTADWFYIGTEERPFCGSFDGDGHSISGKFLFMDGMSIPEALFQKSPSAKIENLQVINGMNRSLRNILVYQCVKEQEDCEELLENLAFFPDCSIRLTVCNGGLDTREIAEELHDRWERNQEQEDFFISVDIYSEPETWSPEENYIQDIMEPFNGIAGEEYRAVIEEAMEQEEGYLTYIQLKRIGELNCCSFEIGKWGIEEPLWDDGYYIILEGKWEGRKVPLQHFYIPYTAFESSALTDDNGAYWVEAVDLDFDGKEDLLIHEGYSGGSGGSWENYRAIVWREKEGRFAYLPSFPEKVYCLEFDRQRVVSGGSGGWGYEHVVVYGVINGEYMPVRELVDEMIYSEEKQDYIHVLSYYEMGELVRKHILEDEQEKEQLYPDMNYWRKG